MPLHPGSSNYFIGNLLKNYGAMYIFGGGIITAFKLAGFLLAGDFTSAQAIGDTAVAVFMPSASSLVLNPVVGAAVAMLKWSRGMRLA